MKKLDEIALINKKHWERMVDEGCGFTRPWLDLDREKISQYLNGQIHQIPEHLLEIYPLNILTDIDSKDVLCLGAGGGQQSAVFGLLGARVSVIDLSERQLEMDRRAAAHYGYKINLIQSDMREFSQVEDSSFDLVYGTGMCYIPDVKQVYAEVNRVLRINKTYRVDFTNPATEFVECDDWNGRGYSITKPYAERVRRQDNGPIEYRHTLSDIFNGLITSGFSIEHVQEKPYYQQKLDDQPGSWAHWLTYITGFTILAKKQSSLKASI